MTSADLFVAPVIAMLILSLTILLQPYVTLEENRRFFLPALLPKFAGAIALGLRV